MSTEGIEQARGHEDAAARISTGVRGQTLVIEGWFASHADKNAPGPHVRLGAIGRDVGGHAVLKTSQIPELIACLELVAARIDRQWDRDGDDFLRDFGDAPDENDPAVVRKRRKDHMVFLNKLHAHFAEVADILLRADTSHDASAAIAPLIGVDEDEVEVRLRSVNLFSLTGTATAARAEMLKDLRSQE